MKEINYFKYEGIQGDYFHCQAYKANLSVSRCAAMYKAVAFLRPGCLHTHEKCIGCQFGAQHAGIQMPIVYNPLGRHICARCHQHSMRLVCDGICVSCYNREREILKGRNSKGAPPQPVNRYWEEPSHTCGKGKTVLLHSLRITTAHRTHTVKAADTLEAMLKILKSATAEISFCRHRMGPQITQKTLWGVGL